MSIRVVFSRPHIYVKSVCHANMRGNERYTVRFCSKKSEKSSLAERVIANHAKQYLEDKTPEHVAKFKAELFRGEKDLFFPQPLTFKKESQIPKSEINHVLDEVRGSLSDLIEQNVDVHLKEQLHIILLKLDKIHQ